MKRLLLIALLLTFNLYAAPRVGDNEVAFTLPNLYDENSKLTSSSLRGKVVLLNLWASWCTGCQEEMPLFVALQKEYSKEEFEIVLSSIDSEAGFAKDFLKTVDKQRVLTALYDELKSLPKAYRCPGMPSSFLIDKNGEIVDVYIGSLDNTAIKNLKAKIAELTGQ